MKHVITLGLVGCALLAASPTFAEPVRKRVPIQVDGTQHGSIIFGTLIVQVDDNEFAGLKEQYIQKFNDDLRAAGYNVPTIDKSIFKEDELPDSDYLLAGTITDFDCNSEQDDTCGIAVHWELLDRRTDSVVYRMDARHEEMRMEDMDATKRADALFLGTLKSVLARQKFVEAVKISSEGPTAVSEAYEKRTLKACADVPPSMPKGSEQALAATVVVKTKSGIGSGVIVSPDGFVLTAAHVVATEKPEIRMRDGALKQAEVLRVDEKKDVALLRIQDPEANTSCLRLRDTSPKAGEDVYVLGSPAGEELSFSISRGIVSGSRSFDGTSYVQTDASINPGNSGGPLVGEDGTVMAIASWKVASQEVEGLGFGVPASTIMSALGIQFGDETETVAPAVRRSTVKTESAYQDAPEAKWHYVGEDAPGRTPTWVRQTRGWGYVLGGLGLSTAVGSWLFYLASDDATSFDAYRTVNTIGWAALGVGAGMVVSSYVFKPDLSPPKEGSAGASTSPTITAGFGPTSVTLLVNF